MKLGRLLFGLTLLVATNAHPLFADDIAQQLESIVVDTFDSPDQREWTENGKKFTEERQWIAKGSKFVETGYPLANYVDAWPAALFDTNPDKLPLKSLGVFAKFQRKGYNYIEFYPAAKAADKDGNVVPQAIRLPGIVKIIDFWAWGSNYKYTLEVHLEDYRGIPYVLDCGYVYFQGWQNIKVNVPSNIPQMQTYLPRYQGLKLTKIVLRTDPTEKVDGFYFYLDQLKVLTDMHQNPYDGRELISPDFTNKYFNSANANQGK